jgi:hypothetical protein
MVQHIHPALTASKADTYLIEIERGDRHVVEHHADAIVVLDHVPQVLHSQNSTVRVPAT